jgi:hypothetical protein
MENPKLLYKFISKIDFKINYIYSYINIIKLSS